MSIELMVPQMGESIAEATVLVWLKKEGEAFASGDDLVELETDKANTTVPAPVAGILEKILFQENSVVTQKDVLALISEGATNGASSKKVEAIPPATVKAPEPSLPHATPLAAKVAATDGVDLKSVQGSGAGGKIVKADVGRVAEAPVASPIVPAIYTSPPPPTVASAPANDDPRVERRPMTRKRKIIADNLKLAQNTAAMLTTFNEVDMTAIMDLRKRRKESFEKRNGVGLGFMSFFSKAAVGALKVFPLLNAEIQGTDLLIKHFYDIGIAVSVKDGLLVPVLRNADQKSFAQIEKDIIELATKSREGKISVQELIGATFTITNGGVFGSLLSTPILNYPQVGILGMHKIQERAVVVNGEIVIRPMMYLALSYDHRIVDGSEAVRFLVRIKELLEDPESLLLEG